MLLRLICIVCLLLFLFVSACVPVEDKMSDKDGADYHYLLGVTSLNEKNPTEALKEFLKAKELNSKDPQIHAGLAQAYMQKRAYEKAEEHFLAAVELSNEDPVYYNNLGALYLSVQKYEEAVAAFHEAATNILFDRQELAWTGIGLANEKMQDYVAAQHAYQKAMEANPLYYRPPFMLGQMYYNQDRPVEALEMFTRSVELASGFARGYYWQGLVFMKMKETDKAKKAFEKVLQLGTDAESSRLAANYLKILSK